ncbi:MAG TPA: lipid kinase, partial [Candidatus Caenarcaniphilales bacterium]
LNFELVEASTEQPQHLPEVIRQQRDKVDLVIVGGGDGTLNAAAAGLVDTRLPLGILPFGTANDLARTLGIPNEIAAACEIIAAGHTLPIDLGWVNGKYFFNVASLGISTRITERLTKEVKRRWGVLAYAATAVQVLWQTRPFYAEIRSQGKLKRVRTVQIAVGNGRFYGGGMAIAYDATINDQQLDLYSLELRHWWQILPILPAMSRGRQATWPSVFSLEAQEIEVLTRRPHTINTDGELTTQTPARFRVIPQAVSVMVPAKEDAPGLST